MRAKRSRVAVDRPHDLLNQPMEKSMKQPTCLVLAATTVSILGSQPVEAASPVECQQFADFAMRINGNYQRARCPATPLMHGDRQRHYQWCLARPTPSRPGRPARQAARIRSLHRAGAHAPSGAKSYPAPARQIEPPSTGPGCPRQGHALAAGNARAKVTFLNTNAGGTISINWIDFDGNWVHYASVARGRQFDSNSFVGHAWVVLDANGRCIGTPVVSSGSPTFAY